MKNTTHYAVLILLVFMLSSCANSYKISTTDTVSIEDYNIYVFRLCEKIFVAGNQRFSLCDLECEPTDITAINDLQVREELYLLVAKKGNSVIYLTTKTDRSFDIEPDIFNTKKHKDFIFVNDFENVYFGIQKENDLLFTNKNETLDFEISAISNESCFISINKLLHKGFEPTPIDNVEVNLEDIYSVDIKFLQSKRQLAIKHKKTETIDTLQTIALTGRKIVFKGKQDSIKLSQRKRLKYHPEFH